MITLIHARGATIAATGFFDTFLAYSLFVQVEQILRFNRIKNAITMHLQSITHFGDLRRVLRREHVAKEVRLVGPLLALGAFRDRHGLQFP